MTHRMSHSPAYVKYVMNNPHLPPPPPTHTYTFMTHRRSNSLAYVWHVPQKPKKNLSANQPGGKYRSPRHIRVCMYVFIHVCVHACVCVCECIYVKNSLLISLGANIEAQDAYRYICMCSYMYGFMHVCVHTCMCSYIGFMSSYMYVCMCVCV